MKNAPKAVGGLCGSASFVFKQMPLDIQCQLDIGMPHRSLIGFQVLALLDQRGREIVLQGVG